jgi:hypothetical protein
VGSSSCTYFNLIGDAVKNLAQSMAQALEAGTPHSPNTYRQFLKPTIAAQVLQFYSELI